MKILCKWNYKVAFQDCFFCTQPNTLGDPLHESCLIYYRYKSFVECVICKYLLTGCSLFSNSLHSVFLKAKGLHGPPSDKFWVWIVLLMTYKKTVCLNLGLKNYVVFNDRYLLLIYVRVRMLGRTSFCLHIFFLSISLLCPVVRPFICISVCLLIAYRSLRLCSVFHFLLPSLSS